MILNKEYKTLGKLSVVLFSRKNYNYYGYLLKKFNEVNLNEEIYNFFKSTLFLKYNFDGELLGWYDSNKDTFIKVDEFYDKKYNLKIEDKEFRGISR